MAMYRCLLRDGADERFGAWTEYQVQVIVASLSGDPMTFDEWIDVSRRFLLADWSEDWLDGEPWSNGVPDPEQIDMLVDLPARWIACDPSVNPPPFQGAIPASVGNSDADVIPALSFDLHPDWEIGTLTAQWRGGVGERRRERQERFAVDRVELGERLIECIVEDGLRWSDGRPLYRGDERLRLSSSSAADPVARILAHWLMTPRADLGRVCPRDWLLRDHDHLESDLSHRQLQWMRAGRCPPGISRESWAFRHAGFGDHEWMLYIAMARALINECLRLVPAPPRGPSETARPNRKPAPRPKKQRRRRTSGEVKRPSREALLDSLRAFREEWLSTPQDEDLYGLTPTEAIEMERCRIPVSVDAQDAIVDCDCPLCVMMAEMPGPVFLHADSRGYEVDFPFSSYMTEEDWRETQDLWSDDDSSGAAEQGPGSTGGLPGAAFEESKRPEASLSRTMAASTFPANPGQLIHLFGVGAALAQVIGQLQSRRAQPDLIKRLNESFLEFRQRQSEDDFTAESINSDRLEQVLERVLEAYPSLIDEVTSVRDAIDQMVAHHKSSTEA